MPTGKWLNLKWGYDIIFLTKNMRTYELTLIFDSDLGADGQKKALVKVKKEIEDDKGKVVKETEWGKKELAYPIAKKTAGHYLLLEVNLPEEAVKDLDPKLRNQEGVLRHLLVRKETRGGAKITK